MSSQTSPSPRHNTRRRVTKRVAREMGPQGLKALLTPLINFGSSKRLSDFVSNPLPNVITLPHWYYDDDAWQVPAPNAGGRDLAFLAFMGKVSESSVLRQSCEDIKCVNPFHCTILLKIEARARDNNTWQTRMIAPEMRVITKEEYEATLCDGNVKERRRVAAKRAAEGRIASS